MKKKVTKKVKAPKPSVLLTQALALFGPKGENWITGIAHEERPERYLLDGDEFEELVEVHARIQERITDAISLNGEADMSDVIAEAKRIEKDYKKLPAQDLFCSIGALQHINTPNEEAATAFLAMAIDADYRKAIKAKHNPKTDRDDYDGPECPCAECQSIDDADHIIMTNNDGLDNATDFPTIRKWFKKAIKLAQAEGK